MRTKDGRELSNALNVIFIELPKVKDLEENIEKNTALEKWAIFLKEADNEKKKSDKRKHLQFIHRTYWHLSNFIE